MPSSVAFGLVPFIRPRLPSVRLSRRPRCRDVCAKARLPSSVASARDPRTGCSIYVVGCVHGSLVSADDVKVLLDSTSPDAVVVELCESRLASLKTILKNDRDLKKKPRPLGSTKRPKTFRQLAKTFGGSGPAFVAIVLETSYRLQMLAGVNPGIEFSYPITSSMRWKLICGDAPARDTVANLYNVFASPVKSVRGSMDSIKTLIARFVFPANGGINIPKIFLSEPRRMQELAGLILPAVTVSSALGLASTAGASVLEGTPALSALSQGYATSMLPLIVSIGQTLMVSYVIVSTLRFMKVLIADRDRILAQSILDAAAQMCDGKQSRTICAVVGLLHVNGIIQHIHGADVDECKA